MRVLRTIVAAGTLVVLAAGCGPDGQRTLPAGRYAYSAAHAFPGGGDSVQLAGVMVVDPENPGPLGVRWEVPDLYPEPLSGERADGAFHLVTETTYLGFLRHRLVVDPETGAIACEGEFSIVLEAGAEEVVPVACSITRENAVTPELVPLVAPEEVDDSLDADTLPAAHLPREGAPR